MNRGLKILIGVGLVAIGFQHDGITPWLAFNAVGGWMIGWNLQGLIQGV